jgi:N6-L-threonylcarbamoyladenine synthase
LPALKKSPERHRKVLILGIESSCDETSAAVVEDGTRILSNRIASQIPVHSPYGGVVPELASRQHLSHIGPIVDGALKEAGVDLERVDAVAVTQGPGLVGSLLVGLCFGKAVAYARGVPLLAVDHIEAHIRAAYIECPEPIEHPALSLVVSGGHTSLFLMKEESRYVLVGKTRDDAAGEAYDKVAKLLGLGYPGGPILDRLAHRGDPKAVRFPIAKISDGSEDFSFSGLKTAVLRYVKEKKIPAVGSDDDPIERADIVDLAAGFQTAVVGSLRRNTERAARRFQAKAVLVSGGVAANRQLRERFGEMGLKLGIPVWFPSVALSTDNAAMIAAAGYLKFLRKEFAPLDLNADVELRLGEGPARRSKRHR